MSTVVLRRSEAVQMVTDIGTAISHIISVSAELSSDLDKAFAMDALVILNTKRSILEGAISDSDRRAEKGAQP